MSAIIEIIFVKRLPPFTFRWPEGMESFEVGWSIELRAAERRHHARHGLGSREVYGRMRVHTVTWLDSEVQVEGAVEGVKGDLSRQARCFAETP
jgi:hypothetical protein